MLNRHAHRQPCRRDRHSDLAMSPRRLRSGVALLLPAPLAVLAGMRLSGAGDDRGAVVTLFGLLIGFPVFVYGYAVLRGGVPPPALPTGGLSLDNDRDLFECMGGVLLAWAVVATAVTFPGLVSCARVSNPCDALAHGSPAGAVLLLADLAAFGSGLVLHRLLSGEAGSTTVRWLALTVSFVGPPVVVLAVALAN